MNAILSPKFTGEGTDEPVAIEDVKAALELDGSYHDSFLTDLVTAARIATEKYLNRSLISRSIEITVYNYEGGQLLPYGPATAITVTDPADDSTVDSEIEGTGLFQFLKSPIGGPFLVSYTSAGYTTDTLPKTIKTGIIQTVVYWFENRGDQGSVPQLARNTMRTERVKDNLLFW